ncbi:MAG: rod shape-determining protein MreD [Bacilli bacterium]|nr:rod shape-determining protein MreD [Bacilli bacterium]
MIFKTVIVIISFLLESIISNYISISSHFLVPLFSVVSLVIIYPYFKNDDRKFIKYALIYGIVYDLLLTNLFPFHTLIYFIISYLIVMINFFISNNVLNVAFISFIVIICYRIITYLILILVGYLSYNGIFLFKSIYSSLIINIFYSMLLYMITDYYSKKYHIKKID